MRGHVDPQAGLFSYFSVEERIPFDHPLRRIKTQADSVLATINAAFEAMYAAEGGPRLLRSVCSRRACSLRSPMTMIQR